MSLTLEADNDDVAKAIAWGDLSLASILAHLANHHADEFDHIASGLERWARLDRGVRDALDLIAAAQASAAAADTTEAAT